MKKYSFHIMMFLFILLGAACGPSQSEEMTKVQINRSLIISYAPIFIAEAEGYFEEYGIELEMVDFNRTTEAIPLVISGDLDVYAGSISAGFLNTLFLEPNIRVVADRGRVMEDMSCAFQGILVRRDLYESGAVSSPEDLVGSNIVTSIATSSEFIITSYLESGGLTPKDVTYVEIPPSAYVDAMANASVDVIVGVELNLSKVLNAGESVLLIAAQDVVGDFQSSILAFGKNLLIDDPELGVRFLAAYLKGVAQYNEGKTERNLEILSQATGEDIETLRNACWVPISPDGLPNFDAVVPFMNWSIEQGHLDQAISEDQFWAPGFLESAWQLIEN